MKDADHFERHLTRMHEQAAETERRGHRRHRTERPLGDSPVVVRDPVAEYAWRPGLRDWMRYATRS